MHALEVLQTVTLVHWSANPAFPQVRSKTDTAQMPLVMHIGVAENTSFMLYCLTIDDDCARLLPDEEIETDAGISTAAVVGLPASWMTQAFITWIHAGDDCIIAFHQHEVEPAKLYADFTSDTMELAMYLSIALTTA